MRLTMRTPERLTLDQMREFLAASEALALGKVARADSYAVIEKTLETHRYRSLSRKDKGVVRRYLAKLSGLSVPQITRLIRRWRGAGELRPLKFRRHRFARRYNAADVALLAHTDAAHEGLSGPALRRILQREYQVHGKLDYARLASISASHIYNLRRSRLYREQHVHLTRTSSRVVAIGERRPPEPRGQPGWVRVDTVHQGHTATHAGLYHLNAVDSVTQWQVVGSCEAISEAHLLPVLEAMLHQFPFHVRGFHSDNGSEFINRRVQQLLEKLLVEEFTKSRTHHSNDNALVEGKNGAVVRKHIGYEPIAAEHAPQLQRFYMAYFNPYLNYHRPCGFATLEVSAQGRKRRRYRLQDYATPYEKLLSLPDWESYLKAGVTAEQLAAQAGRDSDTGWALRMQQAKRKLLSQTRSRW